MPGFSIWHLVIIGIIVLVVFGGSGKISSIMGDFGKGMKSFKDGLKDEDAAKTETKPTVEDEPKA